MTFQQSDTLTTIEGIFDGENMRGNDNRIYEISGNYASKSRLLEGDRLKLIIQENGNFIFKQIEPVARMKKIGVITDNFLVKAEGKNYSILSASLSFFKAKPGDKAVIILPINGHPTWGALDSILSFKDDIEL